MAFTYAGNLYSNAPPIVRNFQIGADMYVGQLVANDTNGYGHIIPCPAQAAGPDTAAKIIGICTGIVTSPTYDSTYRGDKGTYDTSQANLLANDPPGPVLAQVTVLRPGDLIKAPINATTYGVAPATVTATSADAAGDDVVHASDTITSPVSLYSTIYCRTGANRGQSRIITSGGTGDQDETICFSYDVAIGDVFVPVSMQLGRCHWGVISTINAFEALWATNYFRGYCHELNLEEAGKEYAVISIHPDHLWA